MTPGSARATTDLEIKLSSTLEAPGQARGFVRRRLTELGYPELIENATVLVSELVSNAVRAAPDEPVWVTLRDDAGRQILEVRDCSPDLPTLQSVDLLAESGRGLRVVAALAADFGSTPVAGGKILWARLT